MQMFYMKTKSTFTKDRKYLKEWKSALGINSQAVETFLRKRYLLFNPVPHKMQRTVSAGTHELPRIKGAAVWDKGHRDIYYDLNFNKSYNILSNQGNQKHEEIHLGIQVS